MPHLDSAFNLARWLTHGNQEAEDIVQEAFLRAFKFFDSFHGDNGRVWLLGIVRNTFYTWYQQNKQQSQYTQYEDDLHSSEASFYRSAEESNPEAILMQKDSQRLLQEALRELPIEFREVMVMRELEDLTYKQIADIIQIPMGTVMSRLGRGRKQLAAILAAKTQQGGSQ
ncbi:MAG: sigma-70 family RNA polymerase sigma factor [Methylobacter sp.]|nr:sigma-70 family RNA polymerase sigma factor [Methylobacter sp.]